MHSVWRKIVVAGLVILGEGTFASESSHRSDDSHEAYGDTVELSQPTFLDDTVTRWQPSLVGANTIRPDINPGYLTFVAVTVPVSALLNYHSFNPRAPPVPAS